MAAIVTMPIWCVTLKTLLLRSQLLKVSQHPTRKMCRLRKSYKCKKFTYILISGKGLLPNATFPQRITLAAATPAPPIP
ncbi:hypothetical protein Riv7116_4805 [Rivularia sp. PCC 7116]|nr:hypothetical protein Riv7116_4805 [Rivularia sp. PCC 7116]